MEINLKEALLIYSERFEEGHPLRDIALATLKELGRENPFGHDKKHSYIKRGNIVSINSGTVYGSITDACFSLGERSNEAKREIQQLLKEYGFELT